MVEEITSEHQTLKKSNNINFNDNYNYNIIAIIYTIAIKRPLNCLGCYNNIMHEYILYQHYRLGIIVPMPNGRESDVRVRKLYLSFAPFIDIL